MCILLDIFIHFSLFFIFYMHLIHFVTIRFLLLFLIFFYIFRDIYFIIVLPIDFRQRNKMLKSIIFYYIFLLLNT